MQIFLITLSFKTVMQGSVVFQINLFKIYILNKGEIRKLLNIYYFKQLLLTYFLFDILNKFLELILYFLFRISYHFLINLIF